MAEPDPALRQFERSAVWVFAILVVVATATGGGVRAILGVVGGALLVAVSYRAIHAGVDAVALAGSTKNTKNTRRSTIWRLLKFITRFAMLGLIAYVMMVRLRAHPVWMLLGASSLVVAAALEAVRTPRPRVLGQPNTEQGHGPTDNEL
jgi:hypothetical protein